MSQLGQKRTPLELRTELHKMVVADLLGPAGGEGERFTASELARREILSRLLKLNHERWEEEQG